MKKLLLRFVKRFYNPNLQYTDDIDRLIESWKKYFVQTFLTIIFNGFFIWLVLMSFISLFHTRSPLGPGFWHLLNILELGLLAWFIKEILNFRRRKK